MKGSRATAESVTLGAAAIWRALMLPTIPAQPIQPQRTVDQEIQRVVEQFAKAVDNRDVAAVAATYSTEFLNVRVADDGGFARLNRAQILALLKPPQRGGAPEIQSIPTRETVIHHAEVVGDLAFVLITREKDLGKGWEPCITASYGGNGTAGGNCCGSLSINVPLRSFVDALVREGP